MYLLELSQEPYSPFTYVAELFHNNWKTFFLELQTEIIEFFATLMNFERQLLRYNTNKCYLTGVTYSAKNADINTGPAKNRT